MVFDSVSTSLKRALGALSTLAALTAAVAQPVRAANSAQPPEDFWIRDGDRVVFYGDSITDGEWYPTLVQTFVLTRYPQWRNEFYNRGQSGDNSSSLQRFARDVIALKPTAYTFNMGFNDGGFARFNSVSKEKFLGHVAKSVESARESNPKVRAMLVSPVPNETTVSTDPGWVSHEWYPYHLLALARGEEVLAQKLGVGFTDLTTLYGNTLGMGRVMAGPMFAVSRDGVHPQQEGQTFIAYHLLRGMKASAQLAVVSIDAAAKKTVRAARCTVANLQFENGGTLRYQRVCQSLPYPTPEAARPFSFLVQLDDSLNRDLLQVSGLKAPAYTLQIDGKPIAEISREELSDGVNLSRYQTTPMYQQAKEVLAAARAKDVLDAEFWRGYVVAGKANGDGSPASAATAEEVKQARGRLDAAWQACYRVNVPRTHTFALVPTDKVIARYQSEENHPLNQAFLEASLSPIDVDWTGKTAVESAKTELTITNSNRTLKAGTLHWRSPAGWRVEPERSNFSVEPGKSVVIPFVVTSTGPGVVSETPEVTLRYPWSEQWAYPSTLTRSLAVIPQWSIPMAKTTPKLDGNLDDWQDSATFVLDDVTFVNPAINGKKALWNGTKDLSVLWHMKWDANAMYLAAKVQDDDHVVTAKESMMWSQDCLQIAGVFGNAGAPERRYEFGFGSFPDRDAVVDYSGGPPPAAGLSPIEFKSHRDAVAGHCLYEIAIPWERLNGFKAAAGSQFRFTFIVGDGDSVPGKGYNYLAWTPGIAYGKSPSRMAVIELRN